MENLYNELLDLVSNNKSFYYNDRDFNNRKYRMFNYRLASASDYNVAAAWEARGIVFDITNDAVLVCRSPEKFFNYKENIHTTFDVNQIKVLEVTDKMDGSMINAFMSVDGELVLKTKMSFDGAYVDLSHKIINTDKYAQFKQSVIDLASNGYTVNMELTTNIDEMRIVVIYDKCALNVFSVRNNITGEYMSYKDIVSHFGDKVVKQFEVSNFGEDYIQSVLDNQDEMFEGVVVKYQLGDKVSYFKLKSMLYYQRHSLKGGIIDGVSNLFEMIINETIDDHKAYFNQINDVSVIKKINFFEGLILQKYNKLSESILDFYNKNKDLDRKSYAIKARELFGDQMGLAMEMLKGNEGIVKQWSLRNRDFYITKENLEQFRNDSVIEV